MQLTNNFLVKKKSENLCNAFPFLHQKIRMPFQLKKIVDKIFKLKHPLSKYAVCAMQSYQISSKFQWIQKKGNSYRKHILDTRFFCSSQNENNLFCNPILLFKSFVGLWASNKNWEKTSLWTFHSNSMCSRLATMWNAFGFLFYSNSNSNSNCPLK